MATFCNLLGIGEDVVILPFRQPERRENAQPGAGVYEDPAIIIPFPQIFAINDFNPQSIPVGPDDAA